VAKALGPVSVGADLDAHLLAGRGLGNVTARGAILAGSEIRAGLGSDLLPDTGDDVTNPRLAALGAVQATAIAGVLSSSTNIASVRATGGDLSATLSAALDLPSVLSAHDLTGAVHAGRDLGSVTAVGRMTGDLTAGRNLGTVTAGTLDADITATGKIGIVRTTGIRGVADSGDLNATILAGQGLTALTSVRDLSGVVVSGAGIRSVSAGRDLTAHLTAGVTAGADGRLGTSDDGLSATSFDLGSVFAGRHLTGDLLASGSIGTVRANTGHLSGDVLAAGNITAVTAATIQGSRLIAGLTGAANRSIGTVTAGAGGLQDAQVRATGSIQRVSAGLGGIRDSRISVGLAAGADGIFDTADDLALGTPQSRPTLFALSTPGALEDVFIVASVAVGPDGDYGQHGTPTDQAADNAVNEYGSIRAVTAAAYRGDVRILTGAPVLGAYTFGRARRTASETNGTDTLTLVQTVTGLSQVV
jgi:hypothetical protein